MNNIINCVNLLGDFDTIQEILRRIRSKENRIDFNKIEPMDEEQNDLAMDDYINLCLNVYIRKNKEIEKELINTFEFVGTTLKCPYMFRLLNDEELHSAKSKYQTKKLLEDAENFLVKVKNKSIFNGYMKRDTFWGTGSGAYNAKVKDNRLEFITFDKAPIRLFENLSKQYPNIKIDYNYIINGKITRLYIKDGQRKVIVDNNKDYKEPVLYKLINENVKI